MASTSTLRPSTAEEYKNQVAYSSNALKRRQQLAESEKLTEKLYNDVVEAFSCKPDIGSAPARTDKDEAHNNTPQTWQRTLAEREQEYQQSQTKKRSSSSLFDRVESWMSDMTTSSTESGDSGNDRPAKRRRHVGPEDNGHNGSHSRRRSPLNANGDEGSRPSSAGTVSAPTNQHTEVSDKYTSGSSEDDDQKEHRWVFEMLQLANKVTLANMENRLRDETRVMLWKSIAFWSDGMQWSRR